ncbi:unnamed protein product [Adineta ricciae]|uniref:G-protein coupled receptors family 1 profile domain-containing protein n=1 Tax=Adineta ricciae TaxID=249248 RepID=A0A815B3B0_ADIRI|nr:unnamed protein product [Adineta ricciae]CAF1264354.1 unnamed protein product [Adineta ricciae]
MFLAAFTIYIEPLLIIIIIYTYIIRYVQQTSPLHRKRRKANQRNMIVIRRTLILLFCLILVGIPSLVILFIYIITGYLTSFVYDIQLLNISIDLTLTTIVLACITPKIRSIFRRNQKRQTSRQNTSESILDQRSQET